MKVSNSLLIMSVLSVLLIGCGKDQNLEDHQRSLLQAKIAQLNAHAGDYTGFAISKLDSSNLGAIKLYFKAATDVQASSATMSNTQTVTAGGSLTYRSLTTSEIQFSNGTYDDVTGDFQVTIPVTQENGIVANLYIHGQISGDQWNGSIEVLGQPEYGATLNLVKNQPMSNTTNLEVGGARMEQIRKTSTTHYSADYIDEDPITHAKETYKVSLNFNNNNSSPQLSFFKLFSPINYANVEFDFGPLKARFANVILDDKLGTIDGHNPIGQDQKPINANLHCVQFGTTVYGYDCSFQTTGGNFIVHLKGN